MPSVPARSGRSAPNGEPAAELNRLRAADQRDALAMSVDEVLERIGLLAQFALWIGMPVRR